MDIIVDTKGQANLKDKEQLIESDDDDQDKFDSSGTEPLSIFTTKLVQEVECKKSKKTKKTSSNDIDIDQFERDMGWKSVTKQPSKKVADVKTLTKELTPIDKVLQKSALKPGFEQLESVPSLQESQRRLQAKRRAEREKTKGKEWFNLPAPELTDEIKHDLQVIQMRSVLDPKHFYKKNDLKALPKYFQIGKVVDSPVDYYSSRLTKKERKNTIVEELMADAQFAKYNKRKYKEIIEEKKKLHYRAHKHAKRLKKGKKK
ncbi:hypothetical protein KPH14_005387 [Odynerus spinipes]|uniref:Fcf2 pre-rRNA processing C-terminal domain-containing protein n=1 Tax=Odynerus spinipes TaxID=1348599 RepID=A0AAD9RBJ7_9HYME|nr:hypothetical protein KPH14_005387 [Odynerus spinipes]